MWLYAVASRTPWTKLKKTPPSGTTTYNPPGQDLVPKMSETSHGKLVREGKRVSRILVGDQHGHWNDCILELGQVWKQPYSQTSFELNLKRDWVQRRNTSLGPILMLTTNLWIKIWSVWFGLPELRIRLPLDLICWRGSWGSGSAVRTATNWWCCLRSNYKDPPVILKSSQSYRHWGEEKAAHMT